MDKRKVRARRVEACQDIAFGLFFLFCLSMVVGSVLGLVFGQ